MPDLSPLRRPIWSALTTGWRAIAEGSDRALRIERSHGLFGAAAGDSISDLAALGALLPDSGELWTVEPFGWPTPPGTRIVRRATCVQMVATDLRRSPEPDATIVALGQPDAAEMYALAKLTEPGPYASRTDRLGAFIGIREGGTLVAMAGERMRMPGLAEVSAVCTHPDHRGRGFATVLLLAVAHRMVARGETPFLHAYANNGDAIALYERLGFVRHHELEATVLVRELI